MIRSLTTINFIQTHARDRQNGQKLIGTRQPSPAFPRLLQGQQKHQGVGTPAGWPLTDHHLQRPLHRGRTPEHLRSEQTLHQDQQPHQRGQHLQYPPPHPGVKANSHQEKKDKFTYVRYENYTSTRAKKTTEQKSTSSPTQSSKSIASSKS